MIIIPIRIGLRNLQPGLNLLETTKKKKPVKFGYLDSTKTTMDERIGSDVSHFRVSPALTYTVSLLEKKS